MKTILLFLLLPTLSLGQIIYNLDPRNFKDLPPGTQVFNDYLTNTRKPGLVPKSIEVGNQAIIDSARKYKLKVWLSANATYPGNVLKYDTCQPVIGYGMYDEISDDILTKGAYSFEALRKLTNKNILVTQNNFIRIPETGMVCTVLGVDPYVYPKVSRRQIALAVSQAKKMRKPVICLLNNYAEVDRNDIRLPDYEELRCEAFVAICNGADVTGFFSGDCRKYNKVTKVLEGWSLDQDPIRYGFTMALLAEIGRYSGKYAPVNVGVAGVYACKRDGRLVIVNSNDVPARVVIEGMTYELRVKEILK